MRRSKSDPAKYARNYRKISQRRMTQYDHIDEEKEMERLRSMLRTSEEHLKKSEDATQNPSREKRKHALGHESQDTGTNDSERAVESSLLSSELLMQSRNTTAENPLIVLPSKKKKKRVKPRIELTSEEIREAKALQKKTARKLQQLEARAAQKKKRAELYKKLQENQISKVALPLLQSSGKLSRKETDTKKQKLQKLLRKERAGISLTLAEEKILYSDRGIEEQPNEPTSTKVEKSGTTKSNSDAKKKRKRNEDILDLDKTAAPEGAFHIEKTKGENQHFRKNDDEKSLSENDGSPASTMGKDGEETSEPKSSKKQATSGFDIAAQMMASLSKLKETTQKKADEASSAPEEDEKETEIEPQKRYVPSNPTVLKTAAALGIQGSKVDPKKKVMPIKRPEVVEKARYDLPVSAMEFEIMDAIRNHDVTIVCGETGSGKSTQVPQFLYEGGFSQNQADPKSKFMIGITQPRRVAAVSTAKRVCYEMGRGNGQSIRANGKSGNLVSYHTRYETAGIGIDTCVQFMTDGILLQEIQSDLLLRRYSVIVLDESHERNLNTDVLIGLLSVALPLRKKAAAEDPSIVPLKLVLMSATLRVEDFTKNDRLFPSGAPAVVTVPGRTHPVTIHHSKVTELDKYENVAFKKICKIHRKLPQGGILVFLTGKREIVRMVNRLRKALNGRSIVSQSQFTGSGDVATTFGIDSDTGPREMDDEELDAEDICVDEYDEFVEIDGDIEDVKVEHDDNIPKHAHILPLYSLLSAEEQAKVFSPVLEGQRLIVIATNIAETSITIPGISYVVDTGRQKCRNYSSGTGVASYDVMWISKAAADQRAGRAGRTGPGHCYRLYSSSLYARHMDPFALPEVLTRPLEDVVLAMKALNISNVATFPFPTPPDRRQIDSAVKLLANIGCVDVSNIERDGGDGVVTKLGKAVAKLPLGVRYAKILLVAAQAGVLDYAIVVVSVLSEACPFQFGSSEDSSTSNEKDEEEADDDEISLDEIDTRKFEEIERQKRKMRSRWHHNSGDVLAAMLAVGAYTYAGRGAGGASEQLASRKFCDENALNYVIMARIQKMRSHLASVARNRLSSAVGVASKTGGYSSKMPPPNRLQERLLIQAITSGLLDNVALLAPPGSISGEHPFSLRSAYLACSSSLKEPLFLDRNSAVYCRDYRQLPQWVCYDSILRKVAKDGTPVTVMKNITPIDPSWLGELSQGTKLLSYGGPLFSPTPTYDEEKDAVVCAVSTKFGSHGWEIPPVKVVMYDAMRSPEAKHSTNFLLDDSFRWFARFLLEGKIFHELKDIQNSFTDNPAIITKRTPSTKASVLVTGLSEAGVDSAAALRKHWAEKDDKFLFKILKKWIKRDNHSEAKRIWIQMVKRNVEVWKKRATN